MKLPTGRCGFFKPARERRIARDNAEIAFSWLITRRWSSSSIRSSLPPSSSFTDMSGTPVHLDTTSSISCLPMAMRDALDLTSIRSRTTCGALADGHVRLDRATPCRSFAPRRPRAGSTEFRTMRLSSPISALASRLAKLGARAGLVDEVNRLVRQEPVGDVAARLVHGRLDGLRRVLDVMERLVPVLDAHEHLDGFLLARRIDLDRLEAPLERSVLLDVLPGTRQASSRQCSGSRRARAPASGCSRRRASLPLTRRPRACAAHR